MRSTPTTSSPVPPWAAPEGSAARCRRRPGRCPGVTAVSTVYEGAFDFRHSLSNLTAVSTDHLSRTVILHMKSGHGTSSLVAGQMLIDTNTATSKHLSVGSVVPVKFAQTGNSTLRIGGIFQPNALLGSYPGG
jgi:hypothetical protein